MCDSVRENHTLKIPISFLFSVVGSEIFSNRRVLAINFLLQSPVFSFLVFYIFKARQPQLLSSLRLPVRSITDSSAKNGNLSLLILLTLLQPNSSLVHCSLPQKCLHGLSFFALCPSFLIFLSTDFPDKDMMSLHVSSPSGLQHILVIFSLQLEEKCCLLCRGPWCYQQTESHNMATTRRFIWMVAGSLCLSIKQGTQKDRHFSLLHYIIPAELISAQE